MFGLDARERKHSTPNNQLHVREYSLTTLPGNECSQLLRLTYATTVALMVTLFSVFKLRQECRNRDVDVRANEQRICSQVQYSQYSPVQQYRTKNTYLYCQVQLVSFDGVVT